MKFSKLFLAFFLGALTVSAQTYMPDDNFENWCEASGYGDGVLNNNTIYLNRDIIIKFTDFKTID